MIIAPIIISLSIAAAAVVRHERRRRNRAEIEHHYLHMLLLGENRSERYIEEISRLAGDDAKSIVSEIAAELSPIIYRFDSQYIDGVNRSMHLTDFLLKKIRNSWGYCRMHYLYLFAKMPSVALNIDLLAPFAKSKDRMERFFALLALINSDKSNIMRYVAAYESPLTSFECSQLLTILRQGSIAIAYQPMLRSKSLNISQIGIAVVVHFEIEEAEPMLREIISRGDKYILRCEALYALASMQLLLCTPSISSFLRSIPRLEYQRFVRYIIAEGYSQNVVTFFTSQQERHHFQSQINSYKIKIEC